MLLQEVPHDACAMWCGIVVLQNSLGSNLLPKRNRKGKQDSSMYLSAVNLPCIWYRGEVKLP